MKLYSKPTLLAVAGMLALAASAQAAPHRLEPRETEQFDRTIAFHQNGRLKLKNFSGRVTITATDGTNVVIHAVRRAPRERLDHIQIDVAVDASEVSIEANKKDRDWEDKNNNVVETDFDIQVPRQTELDVNVFSSELQIKDVAGRQKLHTFSGEIKVTGATGSMDAETFSGDIEVGFSDVNGQIDFDTFSGKFTSDRPIVLHTSGRRSRVRGEIGSGGNSEIRFKTFSGDVTIR